MIILLNHAATSSYCDYHTREVCQAVTKLYIAVPCFNEEAVLPITASALSDRLNLMINREQISPDSRIVFIDDGSSDGTWQIISDYSAENPLICGIKLSKNCGHQNALMCGLMAVREHCDAVISIDADMQDDIGIFDEMLNHYEKGCQIVFGVRTARKKDTLFKRFSAQCYYRLLKSMGADIIYNHADYRLMSSRALEALSEYGEVNLFLRGLVPTLGFKTACVPYERNERAAGKTKYPLSRMLSLAWEGITSFSTKPIRLVTGLGVFIFLASIGMLIYFLIRHFTGHTVQGWSSLAVSLWAIGGLLMLAIGIIGEYIGKIYLETKHRPRYHIEKTIMK